MGKGRGVRAQQAVNVGALAHSLARLSALAEDLGDLIEALDANPVIARSDGCIAVDALLIRPGFD